MSNLNLLPNSPPQQVLLRCPDCLKLYSSESKGLQAPRPHFYCPSCQNSFWMFYNELLAHPSGLVGYRVKGTPADLQQVAPYKGLHPLNPKAFRCPQCYKPYAGGQKQCHSCGVVFEKTWLSSVDFLEASVQPHTTPQKQLKSAQSHTTDKTTSLAACRSMQAEAQVQLAHHTPSEIKHLWQYVVHRYDDHQAHRAVMQLCVELGHFAYLAERYKTFLQLYPADKVARATLGELQFMAHTYFTPPRRLVLETLWPSLLGPHLRSTLLFMAAIVLSWGFVLGQLPIFVLAATALILIWLV